MKTQLCVATASVHLLSVLVRRRVPCPYPASIWFGISNATRRTQNEFVHTSGGGTTMRAGENDREREPAAVQWCWSRCVAFRFVVLLFVCFFYFGFIFDSRSLVMRSARGGLTVVHSFSFFLLFLLARAACSARRHLVPRAVRTEYDYGFEMIWLVNTNWYINVFVYHTVCLRHVWCWFILARWCISWDSNLKIVFCCCWCQLICLELDFTCSEKAIFGLNRIHWSVSCLLGPRTTNGVWNRGSPGARLPPLLW